MMSGALPGISHTIKEEGYISRIYFLYSSLIPKYLCIILFEWGPTVGQRYLTK